MIYNQLIDELRIYCFNLYVMPIAKKITDAIRPILDMVKNGARYKHKKNNAKRV